MDTQSTPSSPAVGGETLTELHVFWGVALLLLCVWALFWNIGQPALIEPDEGRNAEIAREILLLKDWVTPHYNFLPRLDKPILFFDLIALFYSLFGISEWSARLPSALAALGCLLLTYRFSLALFGRTAALWSSLILLTSVEFFALSQIVILDMLLAFMLTLGYSCFFLGQIAIDNGKSRTQFLCMYLAFGIATLIKGPIGFILPAGVIGFYILATRHWMLLRRLELSLGSLLFLVTVSSWYLLAEFQNPGYLRHFLLEENFARFLTDRFHRTQPSYFYLLALPAGFFPWSVLLPNAVVSLWKPSLKREQLYLISWIVVPLLFFSLSSSKMAHYILPIFPPLSIILGSMVAESFRNDRTKPISTAAFPAIAFLLLTLILITAMVWPEVVSAAAGIQFQFVPALAPVSLGTACGVVLLSILMLVIEQTRLQSVPSGVYFATMAAFTLFILFSPVVMMAMSEHRSSRSLAAEAAPYIAAGDRLVLYGGYPSSLPFYLKIQQPISIVGSAGKHRVLGSDYIASRRPPPAAGYSNVLYTDDEFRVLWKNSNSCMLAFVNWGAFSRFKQLVASPFFVLLSSGDTVLIANNKSTGHEFDNGCLIPDTKNNGSARWSASVRARS